MIGTILVDIVAELHAVEIYHDHATEHAGSKEGGKTSFIQQNVQLLSHIKDKFIPIGKTFLPDSFDPCVIGTCASKG